MDLHFDPAKYEEMLRRYFSASPEAEQLRQIMVDSAATVGGRAPEFLRLSAGMWYLLPSAKSNEECATAMGIPVSEVSALDEAIAELARIRILQQFPDGFKESSEQNFQAVQRAWAEAFEGVDLG
jgi:hypothetical protein